MASDNDQPKYQAPEPAEELEVPKNALATIARLWDAMVGLRWRIVACTVSAVLYVVATLAAGAGIKSLLGMSGRRGLQRERHRHAVGKDPGELRLGRAVRAHTRERRRARADVPRHLDGRLGVLLVQRPRHGELCRAPEPAPARADLCQARAPATILLRRPPARRHDKPCHERPGQGVRGPAARRAAAAHERHDGGGGRAHHAHGGRAPRMHLPGVRGGRACRDQGVRHAHA